MDTISRYFKDIRNSKPLTKQEEIDLAVKAQAGDEIALNKLINANLRFVVTVARQYMGRGLELEDLIAEGNIGLIEAAKRFNPNEGYRFLSYSVHWIRQSILAALNGDRLIRLPVNRINDSIAVSRAITKYMDIEGRKPSEEEISKECGITIQDVRTILKANQHTVDLDQKVGSEDEDGSTLEEILITDHEWADNYTVKSGLQTDLLNLLTAFLSERESVIVIKSFGIGEAEVDDDNLGEMLGISAERCRQLRLAALHKLRHNVTVLEALRPYLG